MGTIKEALWANYEDVNKQIKELDMSSTDSNYQNLFEERDRLRNELLKLEQLEQEKHIQISKMQIEQRNELIRNGITVGTFAINLIACIGIAMKTFKFDQTSTITSTMGRNALSNFIPKLFRR